MPDFRLYTLLSNESCDSRQNFINLNKCKLLTFFYMNSKQNIKEDFKIKYQRADMFRITSICLIILLLGLMSASITHAESYKFVTKLGSKSRLKTI